MKPSSPGKFNTQIYSEAADWLLEFRSGDVDAAGRKAFYAWLCTSPEHMRAYLELAAIWNEGGRLDPQRRFDDPDLIERAHIEGNVVPVAEFKSSHAPGEGEIHRWEGDDLRNFVTVSRGRRGAVAAKRLRRRSRIRFLAVVASVLVAVFAAWAYNQRDTYATGMGEQRSLALADGSTIELNVRTKIRVRLTADRRTVDLLEGQALFHVAKDKTRPFIVQSDDTKVRAIGTEFDVYRRRTGITVTVIEGRVAVLPAPPRLRPEFESEQRPELRVPQASTQSKLDQAVVRGMEAAPRGSGSAVVLPGEAVDPGSGVSGKGDKLSGDGPVAGAGEFLLGAGEQVILTAQATVKPKQPDIAAATAWTQRRLVFQSATLTAVAEEFNRYNARQLVIKDPDLAGFHITAVFASTDPGSLIRFLKARPEIVVTEKDDQIVVTRKL